MTASEGMRLKWLNPIAHDLNRGLRDISHKSNHFNGFIKLYHIVVTNGKIHFITFNRSIKPAHMSHSFNRIWIHAIWSTKERYPLITTSVERKVYDYMQKEFNELGCPVRIINGMPDHIHSLFLLGPQHGIAPVIKQVKGSTSHWINEQDLLKEKFAWQTGYAAYSVSESVLEKVFNYVAKNNIIKRKLFYKSTRNLKHYTD